METHSPTADQSPTKRKRLSLACNVCRRKKVKYIYKKSNDIFFLKKKNLYSRSNVMESNLRVGNVNDFNRHVLIQILSEKGDQDRVILTHLNNG
jgi:hypothetical protein